MSSAMNQIACYLQELNDKQVRRCDDVNGDGTDLVEFVQVWRDGVLLENYTDETCSAVYVPSDPLNIVDCCGVGVQGRVEWRREVVTDASWTSPPAATALTYTLGAGTGATLDDGVNGPLPLFGNEAAGWGNSDFEIPANSIQITADASTSVVVIYKITV